MNRLIATFLLAGAAGAAPLERWVYAPTNHLVPAEIDRVESLMRRARPLGFSRFLLADSKFSRLGEMDRRYFDHVERVKKTAEGLGIGIIPAVFPVGYSNDILWRNPNLAEGLPVRDALFVVAGGEGRIVADPPVALPPLDERPQWGFIDEPWQGDGAGLRVSDREGGNVRVMKLVKVAPYRHYHLSVRVKTDGFRAPFEMKALGEGGRSLSFTASGVKPTQDWTTHHVTFNSLENSEVGIYFGVWGARGGKLWMAEARLEEAGPVNLLRRDGCPMVVKSEDGRILNEGADFDRFENPRTGREPWPGEFEVWHDPPPLKTRLPDGTRLRVSYYHPHIVYDGQVCGCASEPEFVEALRQQAIDVHRAWGAGGYMMSHDEWRVLGHDASCRKRGLEPGAVVAASARECTGFLRAAAPESRMFIWSDMFDPHHNAVKNYYLVRGDLTGSWEGIDREVIVMNWNFDRREDSLKFFSERGHRQILAGYYDDNPEQIGRWLESARNVSGVIGVMYTTWQKDYRDLEKFAAVVDRFDARAGGR